MTIEIALVLALLGVAVVLFATEVVTVDVTGLTLLLGLYFIGALSSEEIFQGFGNEVIVFLGSLFVVTEGLVRTGALDEIERLLMGLAERRPRLLFLILVVGIGAVSAFLSNTATMAAFLPLALALTRRLKQPPSKLLMPLAFASILGGTCTLIGTSTNIVVSGSLPRYELEPMSLFELTPVGLPILAAGLLYLFTIGRRLVPDRGGETALDTYGVRSFLTEAIVPAGSAWAGKTLRETQAGRDLGVTVLGRLNLERGAGRKVRPLAPDDPVAAGDVLVIEASPESLLKLKERPELQLAADARWSEPGGQAIPVHELLLAPHSRLGGKSLREHRFRNRFRATALALHRRGRTLRSRFADSPLRDGDVLLVQGDLVLFEGLLRSGDVILLERLEFLPRRSRVWLAGGLFAAMIVAGGFGWMPFAVAGLTAAGLLLLTRCVSPAEAYNAIDWRILVMVGSLLGFGTAMETTGTAEYLAGTVAEIAGASGPVALLAGFYVLTLLLTQPMSNQASALVVLPLAIRTAQELGLNPRAFAVTVAVAASCSFLTPLEPASLLVYGPGRYRFRDFFRLGLPLTAIAFLLSLLLIPLFWPLR